MSWVARVTDGTELPPLPALICARRCWLIAGALLAASLGLALTGTTTANAANLTYDSSATARVEVREFDIAEPLRKPLIDAQEGSVLPSLADRSSCR